MTNNPEILYVIGTLHVGGSERHLSSVSRRLVGLGWKVSVYSLAGTGPLRGELEQGGVAVVVPPVERSGPASLPVRLVRLAIAASHLFWTMIVRRPGIVHFFLPAAYLTGAPLAALARRPIRVMSRRSLNLYQNGHPFLRRLERGLHRTMMAVLGNSRSVVAQLRDEEGVSPDRLGLIYNGIDAAAFLAGIQRAEGRAALDLASNTLALVIIANLISYKGHADLLRALVLAKSRLPSDWRLFIVGRDDGIGDSLRAQAMEAGLDKNVVFLGARKDIPALLSACDVGLLCSHEEGFSNAILEGMAAGLPMIVTDVVLDGETGLVVPPRDPERLADAIVRLASDPALRAKLGAAARQRIDENFTLERCVDRYDNLYRTLLSGRLPNDLPEISVNAG
jgi:glycosyltransferase involved in cell wall biosynthesis